MRKLRIILWCLIFSFALQGQNYTADPLYKTADEWYEEHSPYSSLPGYKAPNKAPIYTNDERFKIGDDTDGWVYYISSTGKYYRHNERTGDWEYYVIVGRFGTWFPAMWEPNMNNLTTYPNPLFGETILFVFCLIYIFKKWKRKRNLCGERSPGEA